MKNLKLLFVIWLLACQSSSKPKVLGKKPFHFDKDSCKSATLMELYTTDSLGIEFLKPKSIFIVDTPYFGSREIAYYNRIIDRKGSKSASYVSVSFTKRNFYETSILYFLKSIHNSARQMNQGLNVNLYLYDSFYVSSDSKCGLNLYDQLITKDNKYYFGNFIFQRSDSIVIDIEIALKDSLGFNSKEMVMCMLKSIKFKDSTVLMPLGVVDRFSRVKYFEAH